MTVEIKRPVFLCGENPAMTLYEPGTDRAVAIVSFWHITYSRQGTGNALVLWLAENSLPGSPPSAGGIFTDNLPLAHVLIDTLTQHFPEFRDVNIASLPYQKADCQHTFDGTHRYTVTCQTGNNRFLVEWADLLDQKLILFPQFPAGKQAFDLSTVICPCSYGKITINGSVIAGEAQTVPTSDGHLSSTAFLAFAESWLGPFTPNDTAL